MISAVQSALSGLNTATVRLNDIATSVAQGTAQAASAASEPAAPDEPALPLPGSALGGRVSSFSDGTSLISSLVDLKEAEFIYAASAKLLGTAGDLQGSLLDVTA